MPLKHNVRSSSASRTGYALLVCLVVAAISSVAVMGILNVARFETLEVSAKQRSTAATWAAHAGAERAVAMLLDNPALRGALPSIRIPAGSSTTTNVSISQSGQTITVIATASVGGIAKTQQLDFTVAQLQQRVASVQ